MALLVPLADPGYAFPEAFDPERLALIMICATLSGSEVVLTGT
jgi:hypothetical protein